MPKQPGYLDKFNYIVNFIEDPCDAPFLLYLETALVPFGHLVLGFLSFGLTDVIRGYFRPKGLRSGRHGRRRRTRGGKEGRIRRALKKVPGLGDDLGDTVGKMLPGAEKASGRVVSQGVKTLWIIDGVLQRGLFWWLVFDLVETFVYEWCSLMNETLACSKAHLGSVYATGDGGGFPAISGWVGVEAPNIIKQRGAVSWNVGSGSVGMKGGTVIVGLDVMNIGDKGAQAFIRIRNTSAGGRILGSSGPIGLGPQDTGSLVVSGAADPYEQFVVEARIDYGFMIGLSCDAWVTEG